MQAWFYRGPQATCGSLRLIDTVAPPKNPKSHMNPSARAALQVADDDYVLEPGQMSMQGPSTQFVGNPQVIQAYLGFSTH